jgi:protein tyrosine phosphatase (PTP) superfamily phosphohydrolase (DUF442 family)
MRTRWLGCLQLAVAALVPTVVAASCSIAGTGPSPKTPIDETGKHLPPVAPPIQQLDNGYALASKIALPANKPGDSAGIHNLFKLSDHVISGSEPHGEEAFRQLQAMGVKTIISVDGKKPEVERAAGLGMRYVHIPTEYRGMTAEEIEQLAKTFRECDGPFFVHCFHGKHRGPAAAAIGRLVLDGVSREAAVAEMRQWCGTAPEYEGLYRDVATKPIPSEEETKSYEFDFPSARSFGGYREAMIDIARRDDALKRLSAKEWEYDPSHPDVDAIHEAASIADSLRIAGTMTEVEDRPEDFHRWLKQASELALDLESQLTSARRDEPGAADAARKTYAELSRTCTSCHAAYRNK